MKAKIQTEVLNNAFKVIGRLAPPNSSNLIVDCDGKQLILRSQADGAECSVIIPCEELKSKKELFAIPFDSLRTAVRGRQTVEITFDKQVLKVKAGSFSAELNTIEALKPESIEEENKEKPKKWKVDAEQATWLSAAARAVALQANALVGEFMPFSVRLDSKRAFVACYDKHHFAYLQSKEVTGDLDLTVPIDTIQAILEVFQGASFVIESTSSALVVRNKTVNARIAVPEIDKDSITLDDVMVVAKEATKVNGVEVSLPTDELRNFLDASKAVAVKERAELRASGEDKKLKMVVQTLSGSAKETIKSPGLKKKTAFNVDYTYFEEAVKKLSGETITFKSVKSEFLLFNSDNLYVMVSTNQQGSSE